MVDRFPASRTWPLRIRSILFAFLLSAPALASARVIADNFEEFNDPAQSDSWEYFWNPTGVDILETGQYERLVRYGKWHVQLNADVPHHDPGNGDAQNLLLQRKHWNTGKGASTSSDGLIHYAIMAYVVQEGEAGEAAITNATVARKTPGEPGELRIMVNGELVATHAIPKKGGSAFDLPLGHLNTGDRVYFAYGSLGDGRLTQAQIKFQITSE